MLVVLMALLALQADAFRVSKTEAADVQQETLQAVDPESKQTIEVFPGSYKSPYGAMVMRRIEEMLARIDEADRAALVAGNIGAGFDRSITSWRAHPSGRTVALAVRYYRGRLLNLKVALSDDYGRPEPMDPAEYQFAAIAVCSRADTWTCREELLAAVAKRHNLTDVEKLLDMVLTEK